MTVELGNHKPMPCSNVDEQGYPLENMAHWDGERFVSDAELESMPDDIPRPLTRRELFELRTFFESSLNI